MRFRPTQLWLVAFFVGFITGAAISTEKRATSSDLTGLWYMGTMTGFDCNMKISSATKLAVQYGGCFHQDEPIESAWTLEGDKIKLQSSELNKTLGSYLRIVRYKNHFVLVPELKQPNQGKHKYSYSHCFWRNTMKNGLKLSKDAPE